MPKWQPPKPIDMEIWQAQYERITNTTYCGPKLKNLEQAKAAIEKNLFVSQAMTYREKLAARHKNLEECFKHATSLTRLFMTERRYPTNELLKAACDNARVDPYAINGYAHEVMFEAWDRESKLNPLGDELRSLYPFQDGNKQKRVAQREYAFCTYERTNAEGDTVMTLDFTA
ncbi:MAG: hypothetical protein QM753_16015 [Thermomicrobiales bacterium]